MGAFSILAELKNDTAKNVLYDLSESRCIQLLRNDRFREKIMLEYDPVDTFVEGYQKGFLEAKRLFGKNGKNKPLSVATRKGLFTKKQKHK